MKISIPEYSDYATAIGSVIAPDSEKVAKRTAKIAAVLWRTKVPHTDARMQAGKLAVILICLLPTLQLLKVNSGMYLNVNQINNGSDVTGYISWESWFAEELMQEIDDAIGRDKSTSSFFSSSAAITSRKRCLDRKSVV